MQLGYRMANQWHFVKWALPNSRRNFARDTGGVVPNAPFCQGANQRSDPWAGNQVRARLTPSFTLASVTAHCAPIGTDGREREAAGV